MPAQPMEQHALSSCLLPASCVPVSLPTFNSSSGRTRSTVPCATNISHSMANASWPLSNTQVRDHDCGRALRPDTEIFVCTIYTTAQTGMPRLNEHVVTDVRLLTKGKVHGYRLCCTSGEQNTIAL
jgi:hypothetical protein